MSSGNLIFVNKLLMGMDVDRNTSVSSRVKTLSLTGYLDPGCDCHYTIMMSKFLGELDEEASSQHFEDKKYVRTSVSGFPLTPDVCLYWQTGGSGFLPN